MLAVDHSVCIARRIGRGQAEQFIPSIETGPAHYGPRRAVAFLTTNRKRLSKLSHAEGSKHLARA